MSILWWYSDRPPFILLNNLFFHNNSVAHEPCHAHWRSPPPLIVSFPEVSLGGHAIFLSFLWWREIDHIFYLCQLHSPTFFSKNLFHRIWQNTPISISSHPCMVAKTFKSKSLAFSMHYPAQPFHPDLVLACVLGHFSGESFVVNSSIGLLTGDKDWCGVSLVCLFQSTLLIPV